MVCGGGRVSQATSLSQLIQQPHAPQPWQPDIPLVPWHEEGYSRRALQAALAHVQGQHNPYAQEITKQVQWLHERILRKRAGRVLELAAGPGFYSTSLAQKGHHVHGIDLGPALMAYAQRIATQQGLSATYQAGDMRELPFGQGYTLVMLRAGAFNRLRRSDAANVLKRAYAALADGAWLLLELAPLDRLREEAMAPPTWQAVESGAFSSTPYVHLQTGAWHDTAAVAAQGHFIIHAEDARVEPFATYAQAYAPWQLQQLLEQHAFVHIDLQASHDSHGRAWLFLTARKL